jgi:hypothetical protein
MLKSLTASYLPRAFIRTVAVIQLVRGQPLVHRITWPDLAQGVVIRLGTVWESQWPVREEDMQPSRQKKFPGMNQMRGVGNEML